MSCFIRGCMEGYIALVRLYKNFALFKLWCPTFLNSKYVIQVYPVRLSTCNLHGKTNKSGITVLIPHVNMKQFVLSVPAREQVGDRPDIWLEAGGVCFGPIQLDAAMALPCPEFRALQDRFLKHHDELTHRLWFLWPPDIKTMSPKVIGKCGCLGGSRFFGNNRNGQRVFVPSDQDFVDSVNAAVYHICRDGVNFGFGQSLLQKGQFMFDMTASLLQVTPCKRKLKAFAKQQDVLNESGASWATSDTLVPPSGIPVIPSPDGDSQTSGSPKTVISDVESYMALRKRKLTLPVDSAHGNSQPPPGTSRAADVAIRAGAGQTREDNIQEESYPCVSDPTESTDGLSQDESVKTESHMSLPDIVPRSQQQQQQQEKRGHERHYSHDLSQKSHRVKYAPDAMAPGTPPGEVGGKIPQQASLASPILRRLSSQLSVQRDGSITSVTTGSSSDKYFSAAESMSSIGTAQNPDQDQDMVDSDVSYSSFPYYGRKASQGSDIYSDTSSQGMVTPTVEVVPATGERRHSVSSTNSSTSTRSFVSAVSSQRASRIDIQKSHSSSDSDITINAGEDPDMSRWAANDYIDLHGQINQPITKSPLLMSCYLNHMTQLHCSHWTSPAPLPHLQGKVSVSQNPSAAGLHSHQSSPLITDTSGSPAWIPRFVYFSEGFTPNLMVNKQRPPSPPGLTTPTPKTASSDRTRKFFPSQEDVSPSGKKMLESCDEYFKWHFCHLCKFNICYLITCIILYKFLCAVFPPFRLHLYFCLFG